jgi:hypothetical protein
VRNKYSQRWLAKYSVNGLLSCRIISNTMRVVCLLTLLTAAGVRAQTTEGIDFFEKSVRPLLAKRCYSCHSAKTNAAQGGLYLDSIDSMLKGGKSGAPAVVPGKPESSLLIKAIQRLNKDLTMPPGSPLPFSEVEAIVAWVKMGAPAPRSGGAAIPEWPDYDWEKARRHWAFQPVKDAPPPVVSDPTWSRHPLDRFIKARLDAKRIQPLGRASRIALIRRATFDLTGLPPTPSEVDAFLADASTEAFEKVVDRLLSSPHYGERWGRHWMDVVRYADTSGCNSDYPIPSMFRYRNYVIDAFNTDKPYDEFLREQIAGDLLPAKDKEDWQENVVATGYIANSRRFGSRKAEFHLTIEDTIDNLGKGILGLSVACARCHDHKFDPIPQRDYYALYGMFQSTAYAFPGTEIYPRTKGFAGLGTPEQNARLGKSEDELYALDELIEDIKAGRVKKATPEETKVYRAEVMERYRRALAQIPDVPKAYSATDGKPVNARIQIKGDPKILGPEVPRGFLTILGGARVPYHETGSGRRHLAEWIVDPSNPLTARVMMNRIWAWHFGKGLVPTTNDFGARGEAPTHPELLDWLTTRFRASGFSVKAMHRLIMLSRTYQSAAGHHPANAMADPANTLYWRFDRRRLSAEEMRDAILNVSGALDRSRPGAHPFPPEREWTYTQHKPFLAHYETNARSVYLMQQRIRRHPWLDLFDGADTNATTGLRTVNITALQALSAMNSPFVHEQADNLAVRVGMAYTTPASRIGYAYKLLFSRRPTAAELSEGQKYIQQAEASLTAFEREERPRAAWASYMRVLLSANEFLYLD